MSSVASTTTTPSPTKRQVARSSAESPSPSKRAKLLRPQTTSPLVLTTRTTPTRVPELSTAATMSEEKTKTDQLYEPKLDFFEIIDNMTPEQRKASCLKLFGTETNPYKNAAWFSKGEDVAYEAQGADDDDDSGEDGDDDDDNDADRPAQQEQQEQQSKQVVSEAKAQPSSTSSGTVVAAAPDSGFIIGDEVFGVNMAPFKPGSGTMAEIADIDLAAAPVVKKPSNWTHAQAAGLGCVFLTAHTCVDGVAPWVDASDNKRVVVLGGSSATGIYTITLCKRRGWKVLTSCSGRNDDFVTKTLGADQVVDYTKNSVRDAVKAFQPAAIIDDVGGKECLGIAKRYVTIVGDKTSRGSMGGAMTYLWSPMQWLRWAIGYVGLGERYDILNLEPKKENLEDARQLKPNEIIIDSIHPFEEANKAFEKLNSGRARGKVIVEMIKS